MCGVWQELLNNEAHKTGVVNFIYLINSSTSLSNTLCHYTTLQLFRLPLQNSYQQYNSLMNTTKWVSLTEAENIIKLCIAHATIFLIFWYLITAHSFCLKHLDFIFSYLYPPMRDEFPNSIIMLFCSLLWFSLFIHLHVLLFAFSCKDARIWIHIWLWHLYSKCRMVF